MSLKLNIDVSEIAKAFKEISLEVEQDLQKAVGNLAAMTHAKVAELASQELHSSLKTLQKSLGFEEISPGVWVVSIDEKALWIEEGIEPNTDMKPGLLKNAKTSKDGHRYKVIPFDHGKAPSQMNPVAQQLVSEIRRGLEKANIPFKKIEKDANGSPKMGKLHTLDLGGPIPGKGNTPALQGLNIYQSKGKNGNIRRDILTFRTVTDGPGSAGKWIHPGFQGKEFLDRAFSWAEEKWNNEILPDVLKKWES